ncbi:MAG TPA: type IX secretion system membrane protein PorP/SprF [Bacteroidetes bacterium]|nr:type IX secretion system membrane protein PorP/SprF [Bacteroidota bacterium]
MVRLRLTYLMLLLALGFSAQAQQDPLYSQYMFNRLVLNPAYAGSREQLSIVALARQQWTGFEGAPRTQTIALHTPTPDQRHGFGLSIVNDALGFTSNFAATAAYAYRIPVGNGQLALGLNAGINSYWLRLSEVDTQDPGDESFGAGGDFQRWQFMAGPGIYFSNAHFYLGAAAPNVIPHRLYDTYYEQLVAADQVHYTAMGGGILNIGSGVKFKPSFTLRISNAAPISLDLTGAFLLKDRLWLGASWRPNQTWVFIGEIYLTNMLRIGYAFDYAQQATRSYFGPSHELMLGIDLGFAKNKIISPKLF